MWLVEEELSQDPDRVILSDKLSTLRKLSASLGYRPGCRILSLRLQSLVVRVNQVLAHERDQNTLDLLNDHLLLQCRLFSDGR